MLLNIKNKLKLKKNEIMLFEVIYIFLIHLAKN